MNFFDYLVDTAPIFLDATWVTLRLTGAALVMAVIFGSVVAAMSMSSVAVLRWIATGFIGLIRGTPLIAQLFVLYFGIVEIVVLPAFWAGAIALGVHNSAYIAEIIRSGFGSVPVGLDEASRSLGMSRFQTLRRVRAPLATRAMLPVLGSQVIIAVKDSSLVYVLGLSATGYELTKYGKDLASQYANLTPLIVAGFCYLLITLPLSILVRRMEARQKKER